MESFLMMRILKSELMRQEEYGLRNMSILKDIMTADGGKISDIVL